jgi:hypothetical protein
MAAEEQKYFERLNIPVLSIEGIKNLIKDDVIDTIKCWDMGRNIEKQCFHIIGPAGVGKTAICGQLTEELTELTNKHFDMIMVKSPVLSRDDIMIPFPVIEGKKKGFEMLYSDFVPDGEDTYGLFVIDECSRGDHSLQQLFWQVQNEYAVHLKPFPKGWFVITTDNPDDSEYQMDTMEDAAGLRRQLHIYTEVSVKDFLSHGNKVGFHPLIIEFISANPDFLYDFEAQKMGSVFANPASYEKLSNHLHKMDRDGKGNFSREQFFRIEALASGLLNVNKARMFVEFAMEGKDINPRDIFFDLPKVRAALKELVDKKDNAGISKIMTGFINYLTTQCPKYEKDGKELQYVGEYLSTVPLDASAIFVTSIDTFGRNTKEFKYMTNMHVELMKQPNYKANFYEAIVKLSNKE